MEDMPWAESENASIGSSTSGLGRVNSADNGESEKASVRGQCTC